jgi:predicted nucleic acid-binding protein
MAKRKNKIIYLDTNVILDYSLKRNNEATLLVESVRSRKWKIITSSFSIVEMSDWKKRDLFIRNKLELNWSMDSIFSKKNNTDLGKYEFEKVEKWLLDSAITIKPDYIDLADGAAWGALREISTNTNLLAKDALHFCTAYVSALNKQCDFFVSSDGELRKEAQAYLKKVRKKKNLTILTPKGFVKKFPATY